MALSQLTVLHQLEAAPHGELPLKELERELRVAQSTAAGIVSRMEQKGFVEGCIRSDKRIKVVRITDAGHACFLEAQRYARESEMQLLSALTVEEQSLFRSLLKKVSERL